MASASEGFDALRIGYDRGRLDRASAGEDPLALFERWLREAVAAGIAEPNAMTLATADADGRPSARMVLLKDSSAQGLSFFTNYGSRKAADLEVNPRAALVFHWQPLHRQVRVEGEVSRVPPAESDAYFAGRPRGSQIGARASRQSRVLESRERLEAEVAALERRYAGREIPRPDDWGGYRLRPDAFEFWQGRPSRLHDRLRFQGDGEGGWRIERLSP